MGRICVRAPFNAKFSSEANRFDGRWNGSAWSFKRKHEQGIRKLCYDIYGCDGDSEELCTVHVEFSREFRVLYGLLLLWGRPLARASSHRSGAELYSGVTVLRGGFDSGGTVKKWHALVRRHTAILVHDFPRLSIGRVAAEEGKENGFTITIASDKESATHDTWRRERDTWLMRLAAVNRLLAGSAST